MSQLLISNWIARSYRCRCCWFLHTHGVDADLTKKRDHKSCSWILVWVFVVWLGQIIFRYEIKKMLSRERLDWQTRDITRLWSDLFTVYSQALVRQYNKRHHQSCSSFSIKVVVVRLGQIIFRCEIKKMLSRELYALPQIEITMRWSDICLLFTTTFWSEYVSRREWYCITWKAISKFCTTTCISS